MTLSHALDPRLDRLLVTRTGRFNTNERFVGAIIALGLILALWLFTGFYRSMTRGVRALIRNLEAVASGDFRRLARSKVTRSGRWASR